MNQIKNILSIGFFVLLVIILLQECGDSKKTVITTPEINGTIRDTITKIEYKPIAVKGDELVVYKNVVREVIVKQIDTAYMAYPGVTDTIRTQSFSKVLEDEHLKLRMYGTVTGWIDTLDIDYTIKPIPVASPAVKSSRWGIGLSVGYSVDGRPYLGGGLNYQLIRL